MPRIEIELTDDELAVISNMANLNQMDVPSYIVKIMTTDAKFIEALKINRMVSDSLNNELINQLIQEKDKSNQLERENKKNCARLEANRIKAHRHYSSIAAIRHKTNRERKEKAITHFKQEQAETGISKNQFAKQYSSQYHVTEKALREWLKNCEYHEYYP